MTSLSPADAERLRLAFLRCRDMEGPLSERLNAYASAGRDIFPAYSDAVDRLVAAFMKTAAARTRRTPASRCRLSCCRMRPEHWSACSPCWRRDRSR